MDGRNCWTNKTSLEIGLIIVLLVAVPYLIAIVLVYIISSVRLSGYSLNCNEFCKSNSSPPTVKSAPILRMSDEDYSRSFITLAPRTDACSNEPNNMMTDVSNNTDIASIASVIGDVYEDDFSNQRYLCAGAIVSPYWVITGSVCFEFKKINSDFLKKIYIRAGSSYWSKGGSLHEVQQILFREGDSSKITIAAINLKREFPKFLTIVPISLSLNKFRMPSETFNMYSWKTNDSLLVPYVYRKKYAPLTKESVVAMSDYHCSFYHTSKDLFCVTSHMEPEEQCSHYSFNSFPLIKSNVLVGMNIRKICNIERNITLYLIYDTSIVITFLKSLVQFPTSSSTEKVEMEN